MSVDEKAVIVRQEGILGGRPTFRGTRVQAEILFENLADGLSVDEIVDSFPTLDRDDVCVAILEAGRLIMERAPHVRSAAKPEETAVREPARARLSR